MTKKQKKWVVILSCGSAVAVLLLAAVHFWLSGMRSYTLHLPDFADLKSVTLTQRGGEEVELVDADGEDVLFILQGNGRTTRESMRCQGTSIMLLKNMPAKELGRRFCW